MQVQPYLMFNGRCEEAVEFYRTRLGAKVEMLMRFKDNPEPQQNGSCAAMNGNDVMHTCFRIGETAVMASDGMSREKPNFQGFSLSLTAANEAEASRMFDALAEGGKVEMPLAKTFFSPCFGVVSDRFGVSWMVVVPSQGRGT